MMSRLLKNKGDGQKVKKSGKICVHRETKLS
jgi:hypothetical protein